MNFVESGCVIYVAVHVECQLVGFLCKQGDHCVVAGIPSHSRLHLSFDITLTSVDGMI